MIVVEAGAMAVRRCKKEDLKRIAKATGGTVLLTLANLEGDESFDTSSLGTADEVVEERIADDECILIKTSNKKSSSIILRGANGVLLDEMERSLHDALSIVKRTLESGTVVAGGGAVESALSIYLENIATTLGSREQLAIAEYQPYLHSFIHSFNNCRVVVLIGKRYAEAMLVIPKILAVNAAKDATDLVARLRNHHARAQTDATMKQYAYPLPFFPSFHHPFLSHSFPFFPILYSFFFNILFILYSLFVLFISNMSIIIVVWWEEDMQDWIWWQARWGTTWRQGC